MKGVGIRRRLTVVVAAFAAATIVALAIAVPVLLDLRRAVDEEDHRLAPATEQVERLVRAVLDQRSGVRGFVITGEERALEPYEAGQDAADDALRRLEAALPERHQHLVEAVGEAMVVWQEEGSERIITAARTDRAEAARLVVEGPSPSRFAALLEETDALDAALSADRAAIRHDVRSTVRLLIGLSAAVTAAWIVSSLVGWRLLRRWIEQPVRRLVDDLAAVDADNWTTPIRTSGTPEFDAIAEASDAMRRRILGQRDDLARASEALEDRDPIVASLRRALEPSTAALPDGVQASWRFEPAEGVLAGDFCEALDLGPDRLAVLIVDVAGHGGTAGIVALRARDTLSASLRAGRTPAEALAAVVRVTPEDRYLTGVVGIIDLATGTLVYANAAHPPPILLGEDGSTVELRATGSLLGLGLDGAWEDRVVALDRTTTIVGYTDGLTETRAADGTFFGEERVFEVLGGLTDLGAESCAEALQRARVDFAGGARPSDDVTIGCVTVEPRSSRVRSPRPEAASGSQGHH